MLNYLAALGICGDPFFSTERREKFFIVEGPYPKVPARDGD
jgi:hypothetical protein